MKRFVVLEGPSRGAVLGLVPGTNRIGRDPANAIPIPDDRVSRSHARVEPTGEGWILADEGSRNATWVNGVRLIEPRRLEHLDEIRIGATTLLFLADEGNGAAGEASPGSTVPCAESTRPAEAPAAAVARPCRYLIGESESIRRVSSIVARCAPLDTTVLVAGESGTGKELVAEALHRLGPRRGGPFVAVNSATLAPELVESDLFGHERGAFTGAVARRKGKLELARGGTLFLDEIAELPLDSQAKLLRAIETRSFQRVGGHEALTTDARFVAATHRDLAAAAAEGRFREDLLYRLRVVQIDVPPLRERPEDLGPLVEHLLGDLRSRIPTRVSGLSAAALEVLRAYPFPGNVRELRNLLERCLIFAEGAEIDAGDLPREVREGARAGASAVGTLAEAERRLVVRALADCGGNKTRAATMLGIDRATLYGKMRRHGIDP